MKIVAITLVSIALIVLFSVNLVSAQTLQSDEFEGSGQALQSFWKVNNGDKSDWELNNGQLTIDGGFDQNLWLNDTTTRFYQVTDETQFEIESSFIVDYAAACTVTGIIIYSPIDEWVTLKLWGRNNEEARVQFQSRGQDLTPNAYLQPREGRIPIQMRLKRDGDQYEAWYKQDGQGDWISLGSARVALRGPVEVGIYTGICQPEGSGRLTATFDYFRATASTEQTDMPTEDYGRPKVRLIYFLPSDRQPKPDIDTQMDRLIKAVQQSYADDMEHYGFGRKTFEIETDASGKAVIHHVNGQFNAAHYEWGTFNKVRGEIGTQLDTSKNVYLIVVDSGYLIDGTSGLASYDGIAMINNILDLVHYDYLASHELRHAFGVHHDFSRDPRGFAFEISKCTAEFLDVHRYFNASRQDQNVSQGTIEMLPPSLASPPNAIRFRFEVTDADGLHQAQLLTNQIISPQETAGGFLACKRLTGTSSTVEFVTTALTPKNNRVNLRIIDVHGNITTSQSYPIHVPSLWAPPEVVSIPDANLAAAVRKASRLSPGVALTTHTMLSLTELEAPNRQIADLTGLEHAHNLKRLHLGSELVNESSVNSNAVSNLSPLKGLIQLTELNLGLNHISDISALAGLTNLTRLSLARNPLSDISVLAGLTNLIWLELRGNSLTDISALAGLTKLTNLTLGENSLTDISALAGLTNLRELWLGFNHLTDISALAGLTNLQILILQYNNISDISAVAGLTNLIDLGLPGNSVSDISAVAGLTKLIQLTLSGNSISNISPLVANTGLGSEDSVYIQGNPLSYQSIYTHLPTLQSRGVTVYFDNRTPTRLVKISGDQHGAPAAPLPKPLVVEVQDENGNAFSAGVPVTFTVTSGSGRLSITNTMTDASGRAESTLTLGPNLGATTVEVSAAGIEQKVTFTAVAREGITIPDSNLRAAVGMALGVPPESGISPSQLATLTDLNASDAEIGDLTGLEFATNLTSLYLDRNNISDISALAGLTHLTWLNLRDNSLSNISALTRLTKLTWLWLESNSLSDISSLAGLTHLTSLNLKDNNVLDISSLAGLTNLIYLNLDRNNITDISSLAGLTNLTQLWLELNHITDISSLSRLTNLTNLWIGNNSITDISSLSRLTNLTNLRLGENHISDIPALAGLTNLTYLSLGHNHITDISSLSRLTHLTLLGLVGNSVSDISPLIANTGLGSGDTVYMQANPLSYQSIYTHIPTLQSRGVTVEFDNQAHPTLLKISGDNQRRMPGETLASPFVVEAQAANGSPLVGVSVTFTVTEGGGTLSITNTTTDASGRAQSTLTLGPNIEKNTVEVSAAGIKRSVTFHAVAGTPEYLWSIPAGISLIHVPLKVTAVDDIPMTITSIADLYEVLGGAGAVNFLITYDLQAQEWRSYFGTSDRGTPADRVLTDDMGIIAGLIAPASIRLSGNPLGTNGSSSITLNQGLNVVGLPLRDSRINRVSDLFRLEGIGGNVPVIILTDSGEFKAVGRRDDPGDIPIIGGQSFIMTVQQGATIAISGGGWYNASEVAAGPPLSLKGIEVDDVTPVLGLRGSFVSTVDGWGKMPHLRSGFRVIVKNFSTGKAVAAITKDVRSSRTDSGESMDGAYQATLVDVETGRAARIGDRFEISVRSPSPLIGVQPVRYTVTAEDVRQGLIRLPALVAYEIPAETELLANYPNPFNPETWIPYRLAEDAFVTLTIYDNSGHVVRTLDVGHRIAAVYENRSKAVYWDGRNDVGEQVASGIYFYHLSAGDYSATRKLVILK